MSQELEIEFKNLLTPSEFEKLIAHFHVKPEAFHLQHNHYFDTKEQALRHLKSGLRIRQTPTKNEVTLKEPTNGIALTETTDSLTLDEAEAILQGTQDFPEGDVKNRLQSLQIDSKELQKIGTLSTNRAEIKYKGGLLVFDHSQYADQEDYELEYEVQDEVSGRFIFQELLQSLHIPIRPAKKKLARFMQAIQNKKE